MSYDLIKNSFSLSRRFISDCLRHFASHRGLQYLFIFALFLRFGYMMLMLGQLSFDQIMNLTPDVIRYVGIGQELLNWRIMDEAAILTFGPGYGAFLGAIFFLSGANPLGVLLVQILLGSFTCLMLYRLGHELTGMKSVGYIAGYLSAMSFTAISLSTIILSDTFFLFLFLWGNLAFLLGLKNRKRSYYIFAGISIGLSILTRSIGQFWPLLMLAFVFILPLNELGGWRFKNRFHLLKKAYLAPLIALVIMSAWIARNYHHHSVPMLAFTSAGGPANIAKLTLPGIENCDPNEIEGRWINGYYDKHGYEELTLSVRYKIFNEATRKVIARYPVEMFETYRGLVWKNLHETNELYRLQLPRYSDRILNRMNQLRNHSIQYLCFWLSVAGFCSLLLFRKWQAAVFLGVLYLYFVSMIGFTQWQGSRLFYPGQMAWSILIAFLMISPFKVLGKLKS